MKYRLLTLFLLIFATAFSQNTIIPKPQNIEIKDGFFEIPKDFTVNIGNFDSDKILSELNLFNYSKSNFIKSKRKSSHISFGILPPKTGERHPDFNTIQIKKNEIIISSNSDTGKFYAINTLNQILNEYKNSGKIPLMTVEDYPKFDWRGMHLDVCRHFFTKDEVKKYIDYLAMYKINTFHWHLTDDQGWRIEIKKYPKLTEIGGWRNGSMLGHYAEMRFDNERYGGFYTQDDIREVVKYAAERHINIVPEIEMPGHAVAAISAYPWLSCTGKQIEVEKKWGVFDDIFCPEEETFAFLEDVLTEVMELFPSKIIHIGGDEAPKTRWKECTHCQALIKKEGLKDEHELQSYFIKRIEKFANSKGRNIIGWDEILEGGLAPNATVMSWRGTEGGIAAARNGNHAVMTPGSHMYFDHYQGDPKNEPIAFGGFTTLEKVYGFNPIPAELKPEEHQYILGPQANLWTEYILDFPHVEYMLFPRLMALSEVAWGTAKAENYPEFRSRVFEHQKILDKLGVNYSRSLFNVSSKGEIANNGKDKILFSLNGFKGKEGIYFTEDGSIPTTNSQKYQSAIPINKSKTIKAAYFENGEMKSKVMEQKFYVSKSTGTKITLEKMPDERYFGIGAETLIDGMKGDPGKFGKDWLGFLSDAKATIELPEKNKISNLKINFINANSSWIHLPKKVKLTIPENGKVYEINREEIVTKNGIMGLNFPKTTTKKVIVEVENAGIIPDGFDGAGHISWLFIDEISLN